MGLPGLGDSGALAHRSRIVLYAFHASSWRRHASSRRGPNSAGATWLAMQHRDTKTLSCGISLTSAFSRKSAISCLTSSRVGNHGSAFGTLPSSRPTDLPSRDRRRPPTECQVPNCATRNAGEEESPPALLRPNKRQAARAARDAVG